MEILLNDLLNDPLIHGLIQDFTGQQLTLATGVIWLLIGVGCSVLGGALGGIALAGKDIGVRLSAMIGGLYGPAATVPAMVLGLGLIGFHLVA